MLYLFEFTIYHLLLVDESKTNNIDMLILLSQDNDRDIQDKAARHDTPHCFQQEENLIAPRVTHFHWRIKSYPQAQPGTGGGMCQCKMYWEIFMRKQPVSCKRYCLYLWCRIKNITARKTSQRRIFFSRIICVFSMGCGMGYFYAPLDLSSFHRWSLTQPRNRARDGICTPSEDR